MIPTTSVPWPRRNGGPRVAGVSSFGFSGTNAHVVLEEAPPPPVPAPDGRSWRIVHLSTRCAARSPCDGAAGGLHRAAPDATLDDIASSANLGRPAFEERLAVVAPSTAFLRQRLLDVAAGRHAGRPPTGATAGRSRCGRCSCLRDKGRRFPAWGGISTRTSRSFARRSIGATRFCGRCWTVCRRLMLGHDGDLALHQTRFTQPCLFAFEYALAESWRAWGIAPAAVIGHSLGEFVAACVAGVMSLDDALRLVAERGRLMQKLPGGGAMAAVAASEDRVAAALAGRGELRLRR